MIFGIFPQQAAVHAFEQRMQRGDARGDDAHAGFGGGPDGGVDVVPGDVRVREAAQHHEADDADDADEAAGQEDGRQRGPVAGGRAEALEVGEREDDDEEVDGGVEAADDELDRVAVGAVAGEVGVAEPEVGYGCARGVGERMS